LTTFPLFKRHRLSVLIGAAVFLQACSTLPELPSDNEEHSESVIRSTPISTVSSNQRRQPNTIRIPVQVNDRAEPDAEELQPSHGNTVWIRISNGMQFAPDILNEQIEEEILWFRNNPDYLTQVTERAAPFIYKVVEEIERRGLPMELALLPIIESAYNPGARSSQDAAGLWQFMAPTATSLGLKRDWWYDARHDPVASTSAAMDYLEALHAQFGNDWLLTLAAYNAGQGNVQRAIHNNSDNSLETDFWSLSLPRETQRHVPRLIGLAHVMSDPDAFEIILSDVPDRPILAAYDVGSQIDLNLAANLAELEPELIYQLNPGYLQWATHPDGPHTVWMPVENLGIFERNLNALGQSQISWDRYVIQPGDTLGAIAQKFATRVSVLQQVNNITGSRIVAGSSLLIPRSSLTGVDITPPAVVLAATNTQPVPSGIYTVQSGDSLWRIAGRYRMTVNELAQWNNLDISATLQPGQSLLLQPATVASADTANLGSGDNREESMQYVVRSGDSLARIAREHGVSVNELTRLNNIRRNSVIRPGQELVIPQSAD
jgi:membrane-bound lytic murein transglycosylase D